MSSAIDRMNDGSQRPPRLRRDLNLGTLLDLPPGSSGARASLAEQLALVKDKGYEAVNHWSQHEAILAAGLRATGMARITEPAQADEIARGHRALGLDATAVHLGSSLDDDAHAERLIAALLEASSRHNYPMYLETHRATLTQDIWRTLRWVAQFPQLRFNADLSHWYAGHEMTYANEFQARAARLEPVLARTRFVHARIANAGCVQVPPDAEGPSTAHFRQLWQRCFRGFLDGAGPGDVLSFNPELLPACIEAEGLWIHYAQRHPALAESPLSGEPSDRFADADRLWALGCEAFEAARADLDAERT